MAYIKDPQFFLAFFHPFFFFFSFSSTLFFGMWISTFPNMIYWRGCLFPIVYTWCPFKDWLRAYLWEYSLFKSPLQVGKVLWLSSGIGIWEKVVWWFLTHAYEKNHVKPSPLNSFWLTQMHKSCCKLSCIY